jgi:hypothetical protein
MATYSQGTSVSFGGTNYTVTSVTYSLTDTASSDDIDVSHLGQSTGSNVLTVARPLKGSAGDTGREVSIEYIGTAPIAQASTGTLTITGAISVSASATCSQSSVTAAVNDVVKGSATFRLA